MRIKKLLLRMFRRLLLAVFGESPSIAVAYGIRGIPSIYWIVDSPYDDLQKWANDEYGEILLRDWDLLMHVIFRELKKGIWYDFLYDYWWGAGQFVCKVCWRFPAPVHRIVYRVIGWRLVEATSCLSGEHINYQLLQEFPQIYFDDLRDRMGNRYPIRSPYLHHINDLLNQMVQRAKKTQEWD